MTPTVIKEILDENNVDGDDRIVILFVIECIQKSTTQANSQPRNV